MRRLLPIFIVGFTVASVLIYFFGDSGLVAYSRLDDYRRQLAANVDKLQTRKATLASDLANLRDDPERSLVMARGIGLYRGGDEVLRLEGLARPTVSNEVGDLLRLQRHAASRNNIFKAIGIGVSLVLAGLTFVRSRASRRNRQGT